jgi:uncharacterized protein with GYD domain
MKEIIMSLYLARAKYNGKAFKGMVTEPSDRAAAARQIANALGIDVQQVYFSSATGEILMIIDSTPEKNAQMLMVVMSTETFDDGSITDLMTAGEMKSAMEAAGTLLDSYKPAG